MRGVLVVAAVVLVGFTAFFGRRYRANGMTSPYDRSVRSVEENAVEGRRLGLAPVQVGPSRGLIRPPVRGHAWFLYWGGNTSTYFKDAVDAVAGFRLPPEIGVLIVAPPGFDSEGRPSPEGVERDAATAREWLRSQHGAEQIVVGGFSMGTYSALVAAESHVQAVVLLGVATLFEASEPGALLRFRQPDRYRLRASPPKVPALVIQAEFNDPGQTEGVAVATWLGARLVTIPGLRHEETPADPIARREAGAFIEAALAAP